MAKLFGAVEAGGTKFVCGVGSNPNDIEEVRFPTGKPDDTLAQVVTFFQPFKHDLKAIGIGTFGPADLDIKSATYGFITSTPKPHWSDTDFVGVLKQHFDIPIAFDTDVNAAALGEAKWGAAVGLSDIVYFTIGTGIGGGVLSGGNLVHGLVHPELGHILLPKHPKDQFAGCCPFHGDACFEGLCSGPAIEARWGQPGYKLEQDHPAWELQSFYVAQVLVTVICTLSPQKIILGGGVMDQTHLLQKICKKLSFFLNGYVQHDIILHRMDQYVVKPGLGNKAGLMGAIELARRVA